MSSPNTLPDPDASATPPLDLALQLHPSGPRRFTLATSPVYWNISGPFGGWVFAAGAKAILVDEERIGDPIEAHARFIAAPRSGQIEIRVTRQSQGRSVAFWRAEIWQEHKGAPRLCAEISLLLVSERESIDVVSVKRPDALPAEQLSSLNSTNGALRWLDVYDLRYVHGKPFKPNPEKSMASLMWVREKVARPLDWVSLIAHADIVAPRTFLLQPGLQPTSTVSMSVYFAASAKELLALESDWMLMDIDGHTARRGFFDHTVRIWSGDTLLATTTQLAWFA